MEFFINKIFKGKIDDRVHLQFKKFSGGDFNNRAVIIGKNSGGKYSLNTSHEFANEFVLYLAEMLGDNKTNVQGVIVSTRDLENELDFVNKKQFMGVKQYVVDKEMTGNEILELCNKLPNAFFGLSFNVGNSELKIKPKAPKSGKPSTKGEETAKPNFCKLKTTDKNIIDSLIFDNEAYGFKNIEVSHIFIINEIIIPEELKNEKDYAVIKEKALRKGKIVRKMKIDGKEIVKEKEFEA